jgi:hypothetical protein
MFHVSPGFVLVTDSGHGHAESSLDVEYVEAI